MAGNNSCGAKSIRYGLMADNVLEAIDALLADGTRHRFGPADATHEPAALLATLRALGLRESDEIAARFPRQLRRVGGYNIDALTPQAHAAARDNLARLLVGSEGTLALSERAAAQARADQAEEGGRHLPVPDLPRGDGGNAPPRHARSPRPSSSSTAT